MGLLSSPVVIALLYVVLSLQCVCVCVQWLMVATVGRWPPPSLLPLLSLCHPPLLPPHLAPASCPLVEWNASSALNSPAQSAC